MSRNTSTIARGAKRMQRRLGASLLALVLVAGCDMNLNLNNPNSATEQTALNTVEGLIATELGMQEQFASSINTYVRAPALVTDEWGTASKALAADISLYTGTGIDASYGVVSDPYYVTYRVARTADAIIARAPQQGGLSAGFTAGLVSNAKLFKAMALGYAAQQYERLPVDASVSGGTPVPRAQVFGEVISLLESARSGIQSVSDADLAGFNSRALTPNFDLRNTIDAMLARYYLIAAPYQAASDTAAFYQKAYDAAARVNLTKVSLLQFPDPSINPIYNYSVVAGYVAPLKSWARAAQANDKRVPFWVDTLATPPAGNPPALQLAQFKLYGTRNAPFPVYVPGEMLLIQAEVKARQGDLPTAIALINQVRAEKGTTYTPGADLGATPLTAATLSSQAAVLAQIAYERKYELFSQGLRWEDLRRLGSYIGVTPKVAFLPMPQAECNTNPNAGC